jgi:hypothetical protein
MKHSKYVLVLVLAVLMLSLPACGDPPPPPNNNNNNGSSDTSPLITVALDYFGVRNTRWIPQQGGDPYAKVQLVVSVREGQKNLKTVAIPEEGIEGFDMDFFQTRALKDNMDPKIFSDTVDDDLTFYVAAYNVNKGPITKAQIDLISAYTGTDLSILKSFIPDRELIGTYWRTFSSSQLQGIEGNYEGGDGDLAVWFRVWSDNEPAPASEPTLLPDVKLLDVDMDQEVKCSGIVCPGYLVSYDYSYPRTLHIINNENFAITVEWKGHSSVTGDFDTGSIQVSAGATVPVSKNDLRYWELGPAEITYKLLYNEHELPSSWSGTVNVVSPCT